MAVQFYRYSYATAKNERAEEEYLASERENRRCVNYIQDNETGFYANAYQDQCVDRDGKYLNDCIEKFGLERMMFVIANTVKATTEDDRWSNEVRDWALQFNRGLRADVNPEHQYSLSQIHTGIVNILAKNIIERYNDLNLFQHEHCSDKTENWTGKVVVLSHKAMKEQYWSPENQLWLATGGFGCDPNASGRAVYATCLCDGESARWNREQIVGVLKEEFMPEWAIEKLQEIQQEKIQNELTEQENTISLN